MASAAIAGYHLLVPGQLRTSVRALNALFTATGVVRPLSMRRAPLFCDDIFIHLAAQIRCNYRNKLEWM